MNGRPYKYCRKAIVPLALVIFVLASIAIPTNNGVFSTKTAGAGVAIPDISAGTGHTIGLRTDGTVVAVGDNDYEQCDVSGWSGIQQVSAGSYHTVGLKSDGNLVAVGHNSFGQCDVSGWSGIQQVSAGAFHTVGLKSDGTAVAVGRNLDGQCDVSGWSGIQQVSAGGGHTVGLKSDGTVVAVGWNGFGQCDVSGWSGIQQVSAGYHFTVGLKSDGTVVAVGHSSLGQCGVGGWSGIQQVSAGAVVTVGLKSDGTVVAVGENIDGECDVGGWSGIQQVSAWGEHTVGLKSDGSVLAVGDNSFGQCDMSGWNLMDIPDPPDIELTSPSSNIQVEWGDPITIQWTDSDPDDNAQISLAFDADCTEGGHMWIAEGISEDPDGSGDQYIWDTSSLPEGEYYGRIWGLITDGVNEDLDCAPGSVMITGPPELDPDFEGSPRECVSTEGCCVTFQNWTTGGITPYAHSTWDFGDGTTPVFDQAIQNGQTVTHCYQNTGVFDVTLTIEDAVGMVKYVMELDYISVNQPPYVPSSPSPADGATGVSISADLSWSGDDPDGDSVTYDVYFEKGDISPDMLVSNDQTGKTYDPPGTLAYNSHYYWQIIAQDEHGATRSGPVWDFTTAGGPTPPPTPELYVSTNSLDFGAYTTSLIFTIQNSGGGTLTWATSDNQPWLGVSPPSDSTTTETDTVTVTVDRSGYSEGPHYGTITVSSNGGTEYISVEMRVPGVEYGTTIITHGFQAGLPATRPAWTLTMAEEILKQADGGSIWIYTYNGDDNGHFSPYAVSPNDGEIVLLFDWADQSNNFTSGYSEAAGDALFAALLMGERKKGESNGDWYLDHLHFIGHSRGTVVNSEAVERLLKRAETLGEPLPDIHVTNLDPHDWGVPGFFGSDFDVNPTLHEQGVVMWDGTTWADTYYQDGGILTGRIVQGTYYSYLEKIGHSGTHKWYVDTIMSPATIWPPATDKSGYYYSRLEGGSRPSPTGTPTPIQFEWGADGIVNGDFERGPTGLGTWKLPGWSQHGGGGSGHIDDGYLELDFGNEWIKHNVFYIPPGAGAISFNCTISDADEGAAPNDQLKVSLLDPTGVSTPTEVTLPLTSETDWQTYTFDISSHENTVRTLRFEIDKNGSFIVNSEVRIDNVEFVMGSPPTSNPLVIQAFCPIDLSVVDPTGKTIDKQSSQIAGATYVEMDLNDDGDLDDVITIPNPKDGDYKITVIPELGASPLDTYSLQVENRGITTILANNVQINNIPTIPYVFESVPPHNWHFTSAGFFPRHLPDGYVGQVVLSDIDLATIPDEVQGIYWFDCNAMKWKFWAPGAPGTTLDTLVGGLYADYEVAVTGDCDWEIPITGEIPTPTPPPAGPHNWSFCASGFFPQHLPDSYNGQVVLADLIDVPADVQGVYYYDFGTWKFWAPGAPGCTLATLGGGHTYDYEVSVTGACEWDIPLP